MKTENENTQQKSFLLLQGVASPFFNKLEQSLLDKNQKCLKINFCGGDLLSGEYFKTARHYINYQGKTEDLAAFYAATFDKHKVTDIALFGDTRPVNLPAIALAKKRNITIHVFEEGYFRPNWATLDKGGVNAHSHLYHESKNQAKWFLENGSDENWQVETQSTGGNLLVRAWHDIAFHLASFVLKRKFPHYKTHRPESPLAEYWGFIRRIPSVYFYYNKRDNKQIQQLIKCESPYFILPLQLDADSQMRLHSSFENLTHFIETTLGSFAQNAPKNAKLVIKVHPLDPWFIDFEQLIHRYSVQYTIPQDRIMYLEAGDLNALIEHSEGTVLVNSTVGTTALSMGCPVIALGKAIYNIEGLTFQGSLDDFWQQAYEKKWLPDKALFAAFRQCYIKRSQINGGFYNRKGIDMAVKASVAKLLSSPED